MGSKPDRRTAVKSAGSVGAKREKRAKPVYDVAKPVGRGRFSEGYLASLERVGAPSPDSPEPSRR